jgi:nucleotide-binding universal stress UspA family protein
MNPHGSGFSKLAVGVDLSDSSLVAVGHAMSLARHVGAPLLLLMVEVVPEEPEALPPSMRVSARRLQAARQDRMAVDRQQLEDLRQRLAGQGVEISHMVGGGIAGHDLAPRAAEAGADLLVVGSHGRSGIGRLLLGSVAEKTVRLAPSSVLVVRGARDGAEGGYRRILVGSDFSPLADRALERALAVAAPGAHIEVLHAWQVPYDLSPDGSSAFALAELRDELAADIGRTGAALVETWRERDVPLTFRSVEAPARHALCERAAAMNADLIVVGCHGRRGLRRLMLGSVAETTVRHAPCSVLVAR